MTVHKIEEVVPTGEGNREQTTVSRLDRQCDLIRVRGALFSVAPIYFPCTPSNHRGDRPLVVIAAQGKSPVGRVAQRRNLALRDRVGEQPAAARASLSPASDRAFGRDNRTRGGFQTRPYTKVCLDIRCECDKAGAQRQRGR